MRLGGLTRVTAVASNAYREAVRERVLYNLVFFAILMTLSGLLLRELSIRQDEKIIMDIGLASMDVFGTLIAVFVGVRFVSKEIEGRSLYPLLARPVSRDEFLIGKFAGLAFTLLVNLAVMTLGLYVTLWLTTRRADPSLLKAIYGVFLSLLLTVALALLFSTLTSSALAAVCTVCLIIAGRFADVVRNVREVLPGFPGWLARALYLMLPNFRNFDLKNQVVYGEAVKGGDLLWLTLYAAAYTGLVLGAAVAAFRSRELP